MDSPSAMLVCSENNQGRLAPSQQAKPHGELARAGEFSRRIPEVDGLRGLAILLVIVYHYVVGSVAAGPGTWMAYALTPFRLAWSGVDLFFVVSGFLIGGILLDARDSPRYFGTFYVRRFYRILPLYLVVLALFQAVLWLHHIGWFGDSLMVDAPCPFWSYLSFTQNVWVAFHDGPVWNAVSVTWSLAVEEQFYLMLPLLIWLTPRRFLPSVAVTLAALAPALRQWCIYRQLLPRGEESTYLLTFFRMDALYLGVLATFLCRNQPVWKWLTGHPRAILAALVLSACGFLLVTYGKPAYLFHRNYTLIAIFYFFLLILAVCQPGRMAARFLRASWLRQLGIWCYGLYLLHLPVLYLCYHVLGRDTGYPRLTDSASMAATGLALFLSLALARCSWVYFEKPLLNRGHAWTY